LLTYGGRPSSERLHWHPLEINFFFVGFDVGEADVGEVVGVLVEGEEEGISVVGAKVFVKEVLDTI